MKTLHRILNELPEQRQARIQQRVAILTEKARLELDGWTMTYRALVDARRLFPDFHQDTILQRLVAFAKRAALATHPLGNRRFGQYILDVHDQCIEGVWLYDLSVEPCFDCHGLGYHLMTDADRLIKVNCQACSN